MNVLIKNTTITFSIAVIYVALFAIQDWGFAQNSSIASLVFLPHGWRIVSFFLFKYRSIPGLWIGHYATCALFFDDFAATPGLYLLSTLPGVFTLPIVYFVLNLVGIDLLATRKDYPVVPWYALVTLATIATLANGAFVQLVYSLGRGLDYNWVAVWQYMIGDVIGAGLLLAALIAFFRWQRRRTYNRSSSALPTE